VVEDYTDGMADRFMLDVPPLILGPRNNLSPSRKERKWQARVWKFDFHFLFYPDITTR
jgi:hypothetical protein